jgi:hypothetical protein
MSPDEPTLHHVLERLDTMARYLSYLDLHLDEAIRRSAAADRAIVDAVDDAADDLGTALARAHQRYVTTLVYAQVGHLAAMTALVLALAAVGRGWV